MKCIPENWKQKYIDYILQEISFDRGFRVKDIGKELIKKYKFKLLKREAVKFEKLSHNFKGNFMIIKY